MDTRILSVKTDGIELVSQAFSEVMEQGGIAAFPTETVYGLGGNGLSPDAAKKIYAAKGRPSDNPLILHIGKREQLDALVKRVPEEAERLMAAFWPGPLTLIFQKADAVPEETTGGLPTAAIRMPSDPTATRLLSDCRLPIAAPSANLSGRPSPTSFAHVKEDLYGRADLLIDGGDAKIGLESTILDLSGEVPTLLRPGFITLEALEEVIGEVRMDPALERENIISGRFKDLRPKAPGMKYRHYAPKAPLTIVEGDTEEVIRAINQAADEETGILTTEEHKDAYKKGQVLSVGRLSDPESIAHSLFAVLRAFDDLGVQKIYAEDLSPADIGQAVMNRLLKAAGGSVKNAEEL